MVQGQVLPIPTPGPVYPRHSTGRDGMRNHSSSSPDRSSPPDIVISSSPTFSRRTNFKAAARKRSQEKLRLKKLSMESVVERQDPSLVISEEMVNEIQDVKEFQEMKELQVAGSGAGASGVPGGSGLDSLPVSHTPDARRDSARDILLQKRVSLTHTPDIVRVFQKEVQAHQETHEFIKVRPEVM